MAIQRELAYDGIRIPARVPGDPLAGIDSIPWHRLQHAYGTATRLPDKFRAALAEATRGEYPHTMRDIVNDVFHQGTLYGATPITIPFLARLAAHGVDAAQTLRALGSMALIDAGDPHEAHAIEFSRGPDPQQIALRAEVPVVLPLLSSSDPEVRMAAAYAVGRAQPADVPPFELLGELMRNDPHDRVRFTSMLARTWIRPDEDRTWRRGWMADHQPPGYRYTGALGEVLAFARAVDDEALEMIIELDEPPLLEGSGWRVSHLECVRHRWLRPLKRARIHMRHHNWGQALAAAFGANFHGRDPHEVVAPRRPSVLTQAQREVLEAMLDRPATLLVDHQAADLARRGLPTTVEGMRTYLSACNAAVEVRHTTGVEPIALITPGAALGDLRWHAPRVYELDDFMAQMSADAALFAVAVGVEVASRAIRWSPQGSSEAAMVERQRRGLDMVWGWLADRTIPDDCADLVSAIALDIGHNAPLVGLPRLSSAVLSLLGTFLPDEANGTTDRYACTNSMYSCIGFAADARADRVQNEQSFNAFLESWWAAVRGRLALADAMRAGHWQLGPREPLIVGGAESGAHSAGASPADEPPIALRSGRTIGRARLRAADMDQHR
ncbi:MAG: hypothetical protein AB7K09_00030 [Planctomycetota bacterium]